MIIRGLIINHNLMSSHQIAEREALEFFRRENVGVLATVDSNNTPFASPVYYFPGEEFSFYFMTTKETHKSKNITSNPNAAFSVGVGPEYLSLSLRGTISSTNTEEQNRILPVIGEKLEKLNGAGWPVRRLDDLKGEKLVVYKFTPQKVTFLNMNSKDEPQSNADHLYHLLD